MKCDFCGMEFKSSESRQGCSGCAMSACCKKYKCPRCGYEILPEAGLVKYFKRWGKKQ